MAGLRPNIYAAVLTTLPVAVLAVILRMVSRRMIRMKYWYDDLFSVVGCLFAIGYSIDVIVWAADYDHGQYIAPPGNSHADHVREASRLLLWVEELIYTLSLGFSKFSILSLYWRLFQYSSIRIPIQVLYVAVMLWLIIKFFISLFQCHPVRYIWDRTIEGHCPINVSAFFVSTILIHCIMDIIILLLPIFPIAHMHLSLSKKLAVTMIFHSGIIVVVASIFVIVESWSYDQHTEQLPHDSAFFSLWGAVEVNMAVFAGCLPTLKPIFRSLFPTVKGMSTEMESSQPGRQATPSRTWRWSPPKKRSADTAMNTVSDPRHLEYPPPMGSRPSASRPSRGPDIDWRIEDVDLWRDDESQTASNHSPQES